MPLKPGVNKLKRTSAKPGTHYRYYGPLQTTMDHYTVYGVTQGLLMYLGAAQQAQQTAP